MTHSPKTNKIVLLNESKKKLDNQMQRKIVKKRE